MTNVAYDMAGRKVSLDDPSMGRTTFVYDSEGRLVRKTDGKNNVVDFAYNAVGQLVTRTMPGAPDLLGRPTRTTAKYTYGNSASKFSVGRLVKVEDESGTAELKYDPRGNVIERRRSVNGCFEPTYVIGYGFDSMDRVNRITYPDGYETRYAYNAGGMVDNVTDNQGEVLVHIPSYTASGQPNRLEFGNGVSTDHSYDGMEHLSSVVTQGPSIPVLGTPDPLQDFSYQYDSRGNLTSITDSVRGNNQTFEYDERNFLTRAVGAYGDERYEYDAGGNMIRKGSLVFHSAPSRKMQTDCAIDLGLASGGLNGLAWDHTLLNCARDLNSASSSLSADAKSKLTTLISRASLLSANVGNSFKMNYDSNGSLLAKKSQSYEYDGLNRVVRVRDPLGIILEQNQYTASGERVSQAAEQKFTVFIDGVYERMATSLASDLVTRHVPVNGRLVASVQSTRIASPLINRADDSDLATCHANAGVLYFGLQDAKRQVRQWMDPQDGPPMVMTPERQERIHAVLATTLAALIVLLALTVALLIRFRHPLEAALIRTRITLWLAVRDAQRSARYAMRRPVRSLMALVALASHMLLAACGGPGGLSRSAEEEVRESQAAMLSITATAYYHYDHLGNVHVISDDAGFVRQRFETKPYGERTYEYHQPVYNSLRTSFNGQSYEPVSGLYHFGARLYDAELGRFISADPTIPHERRSVALNRYAFNANNPIRFIDHDGYAFWDGLKKALVWIGVGIMAVVSVVLTAVTFGAAGAPMALLLGAAIGFAVGFTVGAIWTKVADGKVDWKVAAMFGAAGALLGTSIAGSVVSISAGALAGTKITLNMSVALMNVGGVAGAAGGIIAGATQVARNGCESVALFMLVGWAAGSAVGLATGLGGMAWGVKAGGASMAVGTALSAMGLNGISGGVSHVQGVIFGGREVAEMGGKRPEVAPPIPSPSEPDPNLEQSAPPGSKPTWGQLNCEAQQLLGVVPAYVDCTTW